MLSLMLLDVNHLVNLITDDTAHAAIRTGFHVVETILDKQVKRFMDRAEASKDAERIRIQNERLSDTIESLKAEVQEALRLGHWNAQAASREASDPGFEQFVSDAFAASASTRSESKRRLLGRLISQRLQIGTTDEEEVTLRRTLHVIPDLTEGQLLALAATWLVHTLGVPDGGFADRDAAEAWAKCAYGQALQHLQKMPPWTNDDLETLGAVGALRLDLSNHDTLRLSSKVDAVEQWLYMHGVSAHDQLTDDTGSPAWVERYRARFPTIAALRRLAEGHVFLSEADATRTYALKEMVLTTLGGRIGYIVLDQFNGQSIEARVLSP